MKYTPGPLVGEMSGKQGNTVASHNRFGPYFRGRIIPINSRVLPQILQRNNFSAASKNWKLLSVSQRAAFVMAATSVFKPDRLGRTYQPTGQEFYVATARNIYQYDATAALPTTVPSAAAPVAILSATITATSV